MSGILDEIWQQHIASSVAHWSEMAKAAIDSAAAQYERPCVLFKPRLSVDGNQWCALYGDSLQDGVAGFGDSPADAVWDFDRNWGAKLPTQEARRKADEVLRAELAKCSRLATNYREALVSIEEYWNRDSNERAMHDACWHAVNTAHAALAEKEE